MTLKRILIFSLLVSFCECAAVAQTKTYEVRGRRVQLQVSEKLVALRTTNLIDVQSGSGLARRAITAQANLVDVDPAPLVQAMSATPPKVIKSQRVVLAPRVSRIRSSQLWTLNVAGVERVEPVFTYGERPVLLTRTISARFKQDPNPARINELQQLGLRVLDRPGYAPNVVRFNAEAPDADLFLLADRLKSQADIVWTDVDLAYDPKMALAGPDDDAAPPAAAAARAANFAAAAGAPNDPLFPKQWYLRGGGGLNLPAGWTAPVQAAPVVVAVLDDGVDMDHEDLKEKLLPGRDFFEGDNDPQPAPSDSHGTACAGIIAAVMNNGKGIAGLSASCRILPVRISGVNDFTDDTRIAQAISFAVDNQAKVINCSWGGGPPSNKIIDAIDQAQEKNCVVIASAGNALPAMDVFFPASYATCIAVGAINEQEVKWNYSCWGPDFEVTLVAPSGDVNLQGNIWTTDNSGPNGYNKAQDASGNYTGNFGGTSAAAPIVSGVAAMMLAANPELKPQSLRQVLEQTAKQVDPVNGGWNAARHSKTYGAGKVDPAAAVQRAVAMRENSNKERVAVATGGQGNDTPGRVDAGGSGSEAAASPEPNSAGKTATQQVSGATGQEQQGRAAGAQQGTGASASRGGATEKRSLPPRLDAQIRELSEPRPVTYTVGGKPVILKPVLEWVCVFLEPDRVSATQPGAATADQFLRSLLREDSGPGDVHKPNAMRGDNVAFVVRRKALKSPNELKEAITLARGFTVSYISPVYQSSDGSPVIPLPTLTATFSNPAHAEKAMEAARKLGLEVVDGPEKVGKGVEIRFRLGDQSSITNTFEGAKRLSETGIFRWVDPDIGRKLSFFADTASNKAG